MGGLLLGDLVELKREVPAQDINAVGRGRALAGADGFFEFSGDLGDVAGGDGGVYGSDVHHASGLEAVQPRVASDRLGMIEFQNKFAIRLDFGFGRFAELGGLPDLALILPQILDDEGFYVRDGEQALSCGMDGKS